MKSSYLVDTDWVVHYLRGHQEIIDKLGSMQSDGLVMSIISLAELYRGVYLSNNPTVAEQKLNDFLSGVEVLGVDRQTCKLYGKEYSHLSKKCIGQGDGLQLKKRGKREQNQTERPS